MRIAVIGHTYVLEANRGKLRRLADHCDALLFISPMVWLERDFGPREFEPCNGLQGLALPIRWNGYVRRFYFPARRLRCALRDFKPDIIHVEAEAGSLAALQAVRCAKRFQCRMTQFVWENIPVKGGWRRTASNRNYRSLAHLFCGSHGAAEAARRDGYSGACTVIPQVGVEEVDPTAVAPLRAFEEAGFTVGYVGRLDEKKGVFDLLDAVSQTPRARCVFVGEGEARKELEHKTATLRIADRVRFMGAVSRDLATHFIRGFDALALPSRATPGWSEQFGHVLIEAMSLGVPVIGTDSGAIPEVVGDAGIIVPEGKPDLFAAAIARLQGDASASRDLARAGYFRVADRFTNRSIAQRMSSIWKDILSENRK